VFDLGAATVEMPCPACTYVSDVALVDVRTQSAVWCPCCRSRILLREPDGSASVAIKQVEQAMRDLEKTMKGLFG
jgi:DNA-directed RNA polymerase subunit RPC12/RpoP